MNVFRIIPVLLAAGCGLLHLYGTPFSPASAVSATVLGNTSVVPAARADTNTPLASFSLLSDIHVQAHDSLSQQLFVKALQDHYSIKPDADRIVLNGDLTNGWRDDYEALRRLLDNTPHAPVRATMGNHDYYGMWRHGRGYDYKRLSRNWSSSRAIAQFTSFFGYAKPYYAENVGGVPFLFMSGEAYRDADESVAEDAFLSDTQLNWLESRLEDHRARLTADVMVKGSANKQNGEKGTTPLVPALIFLHQPLPHTLDGTSHERGVVQHERLRSILERYPFAVLLSGHTHWDTENTNQLWRGKFTAVGSGSVRFAYDSGNQPIRPLKSESLFIEVYPGRLVIRTIDHRHGQWTGEPAVVVLPNAAEPEQPSRK